MKCSKIDISRERIYSFKGEAELGPSVEEAISIIDACKQDSSDEQTHDTYEYKLKRQTQDSFLLNEKLSSLNSWIQKCIDLTMEDLGFPNDKIEITRSWGNKFDKLNYCERHTDKYSILTGIFVLSYGGNKNIFLRYPSASWYKMMLSHSDSNNFYLTDLEPGDLYLFPSSVPHGTTPGEEPCDVLYTISFNTFLSDFKKRSLDYKRIKNSI